MKISKRDFIMVKFTCISIRCGIVASLLTTAESTTMNSFEDSGSSRLIRGLPDVTKEWNGVKERLHESRSGSGIHLPSDFAKTRKDQFISHITTAKSGGVKLADDRVNLQNVVNLKETSKEVSAAGSFKVEGLAFKDSTASQMQACVKAFLPFPERGHDVRNRFIVDLAYEMGCDDDEKGGCKSQVAKLQKMSNAQLNQHCTATSSFPDMCGLCLESKQLRNKEECGLLTYTERKDTIISELQRADSETSTLNTAAQYQTMSPDTLIGACVNEAFTDWCEVLTSCGAPVQNCTKFSQQDKKNTYIYMLVHSSQLESVRKSYPFWNVDGNVESLQGETDADLKSKCAAGAAGSMSLHEKKPKSPIHKPMSLLHHSDILAIEQRVAKEADARLASLRKRRDAIDAHLKSLVEGLH